MTDDVAMLLKIEGVTSVYHQRPKEPLGPLVSVSRVNDILGGLFSRLGIGDLDLVLYEGKRQDLIVVPSANDSWLGVSCLGQNTTIVRLSVEKAAEYILSSWGEEDEVETSEYEALSLEEETVEVEVVDYESLISLDGDEWESNE